MLTHTEKYRHKGKSRGMQWPDQRRERRSGLRLEVFLGRGGAEGQARAFASCCSLIYSF